MLRDLDEVLMPALTHWQSPRFFAYFATTASEPGILAELLAAGLNQVGILWRTSPALQELEELALDWLAQLLGLPAELARPHRGHRFDRDARRRSPPRAPPLRAGASSSARSTRTPRSRRPRASSSSICGRSPATGATRCGRTSSTSTAPVPSWPPIGTTSSTAIDPVPAIADACERAGVWLHVDAAYAGSAAVCPELRPLFAGWERADSLVVNPHKWLSCRWTARRSGRAGRRTSARAFSLVPEFLRVG